MTAPATDIGQAVLISREGNKLKAYLDSVGIWTIGVGHTAMAGGLAPRKGMTITLAESLAMFARDHLKYAAYVDQAFPGIKLADHQRDALISLCYNIGPKWFTGKRPAAFVAAIKEGRFDDVPDLMMRFTTPKEITSRRRAEADQFSTPYSVALPKGRSNDASAIKAPLAQTARATPKIADVTQPFRPTVITGALADLRNRIFGGTPNVSVAVTKPKGFNGNDMVFDIQAQLRAKGFTEVGKLDGWIGSDTNSALKAAIDNNGDPASKFTQLSKYDAKTLAYVTGVRERTPDVLRTVATSRQVQQNAPEVMRPINVITGMGVSTGGIGGVMAIVQKAKETLDSVQGTADQAGSTINELAPLINGLSSVGKFAANYPYLIAFGISAFLLLAVSSMSANVIQMFREKRIN